MYMGELPSPETLVEEVGELLKNYSAPN